MFVLSILKQKYLPSLFLCRLIHNVQTFNGDTVNNLYYVNGSINITRSGYSPKSGAEWCARDKNNSYDNCFDQAVKYKYNQLKNYYKEEKSEYYEVWLYANWIDINPPTTPKITNPTNEKWTNKNFSLTLESSDNESGIAYYQYTYSKTTTETGTNHDTQWKTYADSARTKFTTTEFSAERNQLVYVRACDNAGNCSSKSSTYIRIDTTKPTNPTSFTFNEGKVTIKGSTDSSSGIKDYYYSLYDKDYKKLKSETYGNSTQVQADISGLANGTYHIYGAARDNATNSSDSPGRVLTIKAATLNEWYTCSTGTNYGAYCYHYGTVRSCTKKTNCVDKCSSYSSWYINSAGKSSYCSQGNYGDYLYYDCTWKSDHYDYIEWKRKCLAYSQSCTETQYPCCDNGYDYSNGYCYYTTNAKYNSENVCDNDYTKYNEKCYKLSS